MLFTLILLVNLPQSIHRTSFLLTLILHLILPLPHLSHFSFQFLLNFYLSPPYLQILSYFNRDKFMLIRRLLLQLLLLLLRLVTFRTTLRIPHLLLHLILPPNLLHISFVLLLIPMFLSHYRPVQIYLYQSFLKTYLLLLSFVC